MKILLIIDGSISNPIIQSQGIPQIKINSQLDFQYYILSFENTGHLSESEKKFYDSSYEKINKYAKLISLRVSNRIRALRYLNIILNGFFTTLKIVKNEKISVIHCRSNFPTLIALLVKLFSDVNVIFDNRGLLSEEVKDNNYNIRANIEKFIEKICIKYSDVVVVVSKKFKEYLKNKYIHQLSNISDKIIVINNAFDMNRVCYSEEKRNFLRVKNKIENRLIMVYSGTIVSWQMFDEIVNLFKIFKSIEKRAFFLVATPHRDEALNILTEKEISNKDFLIETAVGNELGDLLIQGDFGVLLREPNLINSVASPIKFSEYLAAGLPLIISHGIGDTEEFVNKFEVGTVIKIRDVKGYMKSLKKIIELLNNDLIHKNCFEIAKENLSMEVSAKNYRELYKNLTYK